jgi:hypothetical protein
MKRLLKGALLLQGCLLLTITGVARAADEPADTYVYGTYMYCDTTKQDRADEIFKTLYAPILDAAVADGSLSGYSYYAHNTGGKWRRGMFTTAPSIQALLDAEGKIFDQAEAKNKKMDTEFGSICNAHEDYIWHSELGNAATGVPGKAVFSTYYVCDAREGQADAIVKTLYAPIFDKMVADGKLTGWGYLEHIVGGHVRRVATMTAKDIPTLMAARTELVDELQDNDLDMLYTEICDSHEDYIWEVRGSAMPK